MTIQSGDIKLLASKVMDDVPNGGGGPTGTVIPDGASNAIFGDVTERQRAGGGVSIRQLHLAVQTGDTAAYMDPSIIVSQLPADPNVSITLAKCGMFARRTEIANAIENYLIQGPEWGGYLLENHVAGQRSIQLFQRPGTPTPPIGRTLVLVSDDGKPAEVRQYVRVTRVDVVRRTFTYLLNNSYQDYQADVVVCDLTDALRSAFPGSPPDRSYARNATKTVVRDTTVADAATFYGATPLTALANLGDSRLKVASVFTQLVPSARTEVVALDQRPAAQRTLTLATGPREVTVGAAPHTTRIRVGQENRGFAWVNILKPFPAPGTVVVSYMAQGVWYTLTDDGAGQLTGAGVGTVNYTNGSVAVTTQAMPDVGSAIIFNWGEATAYTNRAGSAGFRAPEYGWQLPDKPIKPGSLTITWQSGGAPYGVTDNGTGGLSGTGGTGNVNYATGQVFIRPSKLLDAGGEFSAAYTYRDERVEFFPGVVPDAGGFATLTLAEVPAPRSVAIEWTTVRNVSASSGSTEVVSDSGTQVGVSDEGKVIVETVARAWSVTVGSGTAAPGNTITLRFETPGAAHAGTYTWEGDPAKVSPASGTFTVAAHGTGSNTVYLGTFDTTISSAAQGYVTFVVKDDAQTIRATSTTYLSQDTSLPSAFFDRLPSGEVRAVRTTFPSGYAVDGLLVRAWVEPMYQDGLGWVYDPPMRGDSSWSEAEILSGKTLMSRRGAYTVYQGLVMGRPNGSA